MNLPNLIKKIAIDSARVQGAKISKGAWDMVCPTCGEPTKDGRHCQECLMLIADRRHE